MKRVAQSEAELLTIARALFGRANRSETRRVLEQRRPDFRRIGETAMDLLEDTLAKGAVLELVRRGGWIDRRGRLWDRAEPPALEFTAFTFELLRWMTVTPMRAPDRSVLSKPAALGDEVVAFLAADLLERLGFEHRHRVLMRAPLCSLVYAGDADEAPDPFLVDALTEELTRRWVDIVNAKSMLGADKHIENGAREQRVLGLFLDAIENGDRRFALFLVEAARRLHVTAPDLMEGITEGTSLSDRSAAMAAAARFFEAIERVQTWHAAHGLVRFFDDEYDAAQRLREDWEGLGDAGFARCAQIAETLRRGPT